MQMQFGTPKSREARNELPTSQVRCLSKEAAAAYLGIGVTLLESLGVPAIKLGRRVVYDRVDLDGWLEEYKRRGRAGRETIWPVKAESTGDGTPVSGGTTQFYPTANAYAKALGLKIEPRPKRSSSS
jgi:hypothetical protein